MLDFTPPSPPRRSSTQTPRPMPALSPVGVTTEQFGAYQAAYDHFNRELWQDRLPHALLNFSRHAKTYGVFYPKRWHRGEGPDKGPEVDEISLNPANMGTRSPREVYSTLVHEMCHLWQYTCGKPSRAGYHNKQWALEMMRIGLTPTATGEPGGPIVGQHMTHLIVEHGPFARAFDSLPQAALLPWHAHPEGGDGKGPKAKAKNSKKNKVKYTCPGCQVNVWGKRGLKIRCCECEELFVCEEQEEQEDGSATAGSEP